MGRVNWMSTVAAIMATLAVLDAVLLTGINHVLAFGLAAITFAILSHHSR